MALTLLNLMPHPERDTALREARALARRPCWHCGSRQLYVDAEVDIELVCLSCSRRRLAVPLPPLDYVREKVNPGRARGPRGYAHG